MSSRELNGTKDMDGIRNLHIKIVLLKPLETWFNFAVTFTVQKQNKNKKYK